MSGFLEPRLVGMRFEGGTIPLEMLSDISVLGEMVIEIAKWRYLEAHPDRERSPRGFAEGVSFNLIGVEKGSAIPVIGMEFRQPQSPSAPQLPGMPGEFEQYYVEARDAIVNAIAAAERGEFTPAILPERYLSFFDRLGRRLRDDESIEFPSTPGEPPARLTRESRRRLVLASRVSEISQQVTVRGYIPELDQDRMTFELQLLEGRKVGGVVHDHHREVILELFNKYSENGKAFIHGIGKYDQQERLVSLLSVEEVAVLDPLDVPSRLDEFRELRDGWLDGEGVAPSPDFLNWLTENFVQNYPDDLQLPHVYPTVEGGVQAEWSLLSHEVSLSIDPAAHSGEWHVLHKDTNDEDIAVFNLTEDSGWKKLAQSIRLLSEAPE